MPNRGWVRRGLKGAGVKKKKGGKNHPHFFTFKGENYFLPNCGKTESFPVVKRPT